MLDARKVRSSEALMLEAVLWFVSRDSLAIVEKIYS